MRGLRKLCGGCWWWLTPDTDTSGSEPRDLLPRECAANFDDVERRLRNRTKYAGLSRWRSSDWPLTTDDGSQPLPLLLSPPTTTCLSFAFS